jgi:hypothetical protein
MRQGTRMKWILIFWAAPLIFLVGWYTLSYYDINFGFLILSRRMHDMVFQIYGNLLGIKPEKVPPLVLEAIIFDTSIVFALLIFRSRQAIRDWWRTSQSASIPVVARDIDNSLSSAP